MFKYLFISLISLIVLTGCTTTKEVSLPQKKVVEQKNYEEFKKGVVISEKRVFIDEYYENTILENGEVVQLLNKETKNRIPLFKTEIIVENKPFILFLETPLLIGTQLDTIIENNKIIFITK